MKNYKLAFFYAGVFCFLMGINVVLLAFNIFRTDSKGIVIAGFTLLMCTLSAYGFFVRAMDIISDKEESNINFLSVKQ